MIDKSGEYWHLYFRKELTVSDDLQLFTAQLLDAVEELFGEIAEMPEDVWFMRAAPQIERFHNFDGPDMVLVFCRFSAKAPSSDTCDAPTLYGFGANDT